MRKKILLAVFAFILLAVLALWFTIGKPIYELDQVTSPATAPRDYALQDDSRVTIPVSQPLIEQPYNALKNAYWGDLHVHTVESFDAVLFGTTLTVEDAYRFARGGILRSNGGELMQLSRPLDFVAITDHAEGFGLRTRCGDAELSLMESVHCWLMETPNVLIFTLLRSTASEASKAAEVAGNDAVAGVYRNTLRQHPNYLNLPICALDESDPGRCFRDSNSDWAGYKTLADKYNQPGILTTFSAYEYSPSLPDSGKHHRNVIFNGEDLPEHATSFFDVGSAIELWRALEKDCLGACDFLTIPHNMNKGWGLFYSRYTWDGQTYQPQDWKLRQKREPLAEMYQVKGASECALGVGATDEECAFSQILQPCEPGQDTACAFQTGFARQGLKIGLQLDKELGFNPFAFGFIGATDSHNANPGDVEEWDFVGKIGSVSSPAIRRKRDLPDVKPHQSIMQFHSAGGLAAVWAEENTRDAIFAGMKRREAYATSGPRIKLRFFAGWDFDLDISGQHDALALATAGGVPMGGVLRPAGQREQSPTFFVWAAADLMSAPLQRIQVIKGWIDEDGETHERVQDVSCADGLQVDPTTLRCPDNGASVDTRTCTPTSGSGAVELITAWTDPEYRQEQDAFYYVRALQNPTCRWSSYDALRLGEALPAGVPATLQERAWSSPIWIDAAD